MQKVNLRDIPREGGISPQGQFGGFSQGLSEALGRDPFSTDLNLRHPFDVEVTHVPAGKAYCPFHSHSAQWEFYHVLSGTGFARDAAGRTPIGPGDSFLFKPGEPHQIIAGDEGELSFLIVADNPLGESCHYPDSDKWLVRSPERRLIRSEALDYFDGEE